MFAMAVFAGVVLHFTLFAIASLVAGRFSTGRNPIARRRFSKRADIGAAPIVSTMFYIVFFYCFHLLPLFLGRTANRLIWCEPTEIGLTLQWIEHSVIIGFQIFLYVAFFCECYGNGRVSHWKCGMTACLSIMLVMAHFAVPGG